MRRGLCLALRSAVGGSSGLLEGCRFVMEWAGEVAGVGLAYSEVDCAVRRLISTAIR
jgi:hypothetical protein